VEFEAFLHHLQTARLWPIIGAVAIATTLFPLRVFRWRLLLKYPDGENLPWLTMWHSIAMGFMANNILPFRIGEVVRIVSVSRLGNVGLGASLSSVAVERICDGLALVLLMTVALFTAGIPDDVRIGTVSLTQGATIAGVMGGVALVVAIMVVVFPKPAERLIQVVVRSPKWSAKLVGILEDMRNGMEALRSPARILGVALWSIGLWLLNGLSFYVMFLAFDIPVNFAGALLMQGVLALGIAVPSAPGYLGVFEAAIVLVLGGVYGVSGDLAVAYALTYHITTFIPITLLGLWSVGRTGLGFKGLRQAAMQHGE
jgi:uncharacterized protein (TIRG00374 family)